MASFCYATSVSTSELTVVSRKACVSRLPTASVSFRSGSGCASKSHWNVNARRRFLVAPFSSPSSSPPSNSENEGITVQDMELLVNDLEYESVWDTKPGWCQPWTILVSGFITIMLSWLAFHSVIATILVSLGIGAWWYIFLYSYPQAHMEMIAARRKRIDDGIEDTYGSKRPSK